MKCEHDWKRVRDVTIPLAVRTPTYECKKCKEKIESFVGLIKEIEEKIPK